MTYGCNLSERISGDRAHETLNVKFSYHIWATKQIIYDRFFALETY